MRKRLAYRIIPALVALCAFLAVSAIYLLGHNDAYIAILSLWGIFPFRFPFVDISGSLAAWDCTRLGIDVVERDPCDVLGRGYTYSPLWMAGSFIPLGASATGAVGWVLGLLFILSLALLPPARQWRPFRARYRRAQFSQWRRWPIEPSPLLLRCARF